MSNHRRSFGLLHSGFVHMDADRGLSIISDGDTCLLQHRPLIFQVDARHRLRRSSSHHINSGVGLQIQVHRRRRRILVCHSLLKLPS